VAEGLQGWLDMAGSPRFSYYFMRKKGEFYEVEILWLHLQSFIQRLVRSRQIRPDQTRLTLSSDDGFY
jgi:hypothetical protein